MLVELNFAMQKSLLGLVAFTPTSPEPGVCGQKPRSWKQDRPLVAGAFFPSESLLSPSSIPHSPSWVCKARLICSEALALSHPPGPPSYLLAGSHCFMGSWLVRLFRDLGALDSSRSVFTKSARKGPGKST